MAGFIHISSTGRGLSISSRTFNIIVEKTRECFGSNNFYIQKIYEPLDEGGLNIISLEEQNKEGFNIFYNATLLAMRQYKQCENMPEENLLREDLAYGSWKELLELLREDNRYIGYIG